MRSSTELITQMLLAGSGLTKLPLFQLRDAAETVSSDNFKLYSFVIPTDEATRTTAHMKRKG